MKSKLVLLEGARREPAIEAHWREWHSSRERAAHKSFVEQSMQSEWGRRSWRVGALEDNKGRPVATAFLYELHFRLVSQRLKLGGIGAVYVRPDLRRLGLGRMLMEAAHDWLQEHEYDGAVLYSGIGRRWYESLGYQLLPQRVLEAAPDPAAATRFPPSPSVLRAFRQEDFPAVRNLYNTSSALQRFAFLRQDDYWRHRLLRAAEIERRFGQELARALFLVGEREGVVVSYLRCALADEGMTLSVLEYGFEPGARADIPALVARALASCAPAHPRRIRALAPSRLENLLPARAAEWQADKRNLYMLKAFGGFEAPVEAPQDERLVWASDCF